MALHGVSQFVVSFFEGQWDFHVVVLNVVMVAIISTMALNGYAKDKLREGEVSCSTSSYIPGVMTGLIETSTARQKSKVSNTFYRRTGEKASKKGKKAPGVSKLECSACPFSVEVM
jgi:hypothetical protein